MKSFGRVRFLVVAYFFVVVWTILSTLKLLWSIIKHPRLSFKKTKRVVPPACMTDPSLGKHEYVTANGIKFHCVTSGDGSKPLLLLLHGFPEVCRSLMACELCVTQPIYSYTLYTNTLSVLVLLASPTP